MTSGKIPIAKNLRLTLVWTTNPKVPALTITPEYLPWRFYVYFRRKHMTTLALPHSIDQEKSSVSAVDAAFNRLL